MYLVNSRFIIQRDLNVSLILSLGTGGDGLLLEEGLSLLDSLLEEVEVGAVALNLSDGQVNQHTGDLGSELGSNDLGDELEDA